MSRAEIAAAARALHSDARRRVASGASGERVHRAPTAPALLARCAAQVRAQPTYRFSLVMRLQSRIDTGTYALSADDIAEQLLGRLMAAELTA